MPTATPNLWDKITSASANRIIMLDGAMGTMLQKQQLEEEDFRGTRFADWPSPLKGNNDLLVITKPEAVRSVHDAFLAAGADLIETNSFNATTISQDDYGMSDLAPEIARAAALVAREAADAWTAKTPEKPRAVLGVGYEKPIIISGTITDRSGRTLSGQTAEAFYISIAHAKVFQMPSASMTRRLRI